MKNKISILSMIAALLLLAFSNVSLAQGRVDGNGDLKKESRDVSGFTGLEVGGSARVILVQGSTESVQIEAESNLLPIIVTNVENHNLSIHFKKGYNVHHNKPITVWVTVKDIDYIGASGGVSIDATKGIKTDRIKVDVSGSMKIDLALQAKELNADFSGSADAHITGNVERASYDVSGSAKIIAPDFQTSESNVDISGSGKLDLAVAKELNVSVSGSGNVHYKGSPTITKHISGSGKIYND